MGGIVCATRGGAGSRYVQQKAIDYARKNGDDLVFLYVIDTSSLKGEEEKLVSAVYDELNWLGQTLLRIAQKRAASFQVSAEIAVRHGVVREEISSFIKDRSADLLLLGAPRGTSSTTFGDDVIERFAAEIHEDTGIRVEIVRPEQFEDQTT